VRHRRLRAGPALSRPRKTPKSLPAQTNSGGQGLGGQSSSLNARAPASSGIDFLPVLLSGRLRVPVSRSTSSQVGALGFVPRGPLSGLAGLQSLYLSSTWVTDLGPLSGLAGLRSLDLEGTGVTDVGPLSGLAGLQGLNLSGTGVTDVGPAVGPGRTATPLPVPNECHRPHAAVRTPRPRASEPRRLPAPSPRPDAADRRGPPAPDRASGVRHTDDILSS
jgi:Leucine-rich repeat (LRR) protein